MRGGEGEISAPPPNSRCLSSHQPVRGGRAAARGQSVELGSPYVISDQPKNIPGVTCEGGHEESRGMRRAPALLCEMGSGRGLMMHYPP
jgi:hypothetical protein